MRRNLLLCILFFIALTAYTEDKIPRRIFYEFKIEESVSEISSILPTVLNTEINKLNTVIAVEVDQSHHNVISITVSDNEYLFELGGKNELVQEIIFPAAENDDLKYIKDICCETASAWKEYLDLADPFIEDIVLQKREIYSKEASFEEILINRFQLSLWVTALRPTLIVEDHSVYYSAVCPFILDFDWFINKTWGFNFSLFGEASDFMSFGMVEDGSVGISNNIALLPGIGITLRSLGKFSGNYGVTIYSGPIWVEAVNDLYNSSGDENTLFLAAGESKNILYSMLNIRAGFAWFLDERWSVKFKMDTNINLLGLLSIFDYKILDIIQYDLMTRGTLVSNSIQLGIGFSW
ncbi:MAG: hypothetical protein U9N32_05590 [Spirochaetota bacterium]|nr:hypothetical protein [Spirochaetota bacterium]